VTGGRRFADRRDAGRALGAALRPRFAGTGALEGLVLGLPRGGVPVAYEVARAIEAPLDVFLVRKLGVPTQPELAMGAVAAGGVCVLDDDLLRRLKIPRERVAAVAARERAELVRRARAFRGDLPDPVVAGKTVVLVDDGLATGSTLRAAVRALARMRPGRLIAAVPVGAQDSCEALSSEVDEVVCLVTPEPFRAVAQGYDDFEQTSDDEVRDLLARARDARSSREAS
jgi:putative phosphoribosyl transferase